MLYWLLNKLYSIKRNFQCGLGNPKDAGIDYAKNNSQLTFQYYFSVIKIIIMS